MIGIMVTIDPMYWHRRWFVVPSITALAIVLAIYIRSAIQDS